MIRLFHRPQSRSTRVLWLLEEIGAPYELEVLTVEETRADANRVRHPLGRVPVVEFDGGYVFESAALCLQIADLFPDAELTAPLGSHERALIYQWVVFAMTELEPAAGEVARGEQDPERGRLGAERFANASTALTRALDGHDFLVGDRFTVADVVVGAVLNGAERRGLLATLPTVAAYVERLRARPAWERANAVPAAA